ncbi:MAG: hypothetical protein ACFFCP_13175 [Promethearchaeota archaeon]
MTEDVSKKKHDEVRKAVKDAYSKVSDNNETQSTSTTSCCGSQSKESREGIQKTV